MRPKKKRRHFHQRKDARRELKKRLMSIIGGAKCARCGYETEALSVFEFHHKRNKSFAVGGFNLETHTWEELKEEALKCEVLCCRCHREFHWQG